MNLYQYFESIDLPKRYKNNVGKSIGGMIYFHKKYIEDLDYKTLVDEKKKLLPKSFKYELLRINPKTNEVAFINSPDFNTADEPSIGDMYVVDKEAKLVKGSEENPLIYHHKWLWVKDTYNGFDTEKSKERSKKWIIKWKENKLSTNNIGRKQKWNELISKYL